jgi:hypothetical protein
MTKEHSWSSRGRRRPEEPETEEVFCWRAVEVLEVRALCPWGSTRGRTSPPWPGRG